MFIVTGYYGITKEECVEERKCCWHETYEPVSSFYDHSKIENIL